MACAVAWRRRARGSGIRVPAAPPPRAPYARGWIQRRRLGKQQQAFGAHGSTKIRMLRLATAVSLSTIASAQVDFNWTSTGYEPTTDVSVHEMLGQKFLEFKGLVEPDDQPSDWDNAIIAYNTDVDAGDDVVSLATIGEMYGDVATNVEFEKFRRFHGGNSEYADHFVTQALSDAFHPRLPLSDDTQGVAMVNLPEVRNATSAQRGGPEGIATKSRQELTMKGLALQSLMMVRRCFAPVAKLRRVYRVSQHSARACGRWCCRA